MKIKEIEKRTGITKANIRYYESQGLITPDREPNGYRTYHESHINPPFGRVASAQIEMKECRQTAAFLIK